MGYTSYKTKTNKTQTQHRKQRVNLVLTIQKKLATWDTQVTRRRQTKQKHNIENRESFKNWQYRETGYMRYTSYKTNTNKTKTQHRKQRVNQELTVQRNWIHEIHKLQDENKQNKKHKIENRETIKNWQYRETGYMRYTSNKTKTNKTLFSMLCFCFVCLRLVTCVSHVSSFSV
jgi:hypothetical protein